MNTSNEARGRAAPHGLRALGAVAVAALSLGVLAMAPASGTSFAINASAAPVSPAGATTVGTPVLVNPTGRPVRLGDGYGSGLFGARRDGGARAHAGVDFVASPGQAVVAPISGRVKKLGYAYGNDLRYRYVEIEGPTNHLLVRVLYVGPSVKVGDKVDQREVIGTAQDLNSRYRGITNHVHLQVAEAGRAMDATLLM